MTRKAARKKEPESIETPPYGGKDERQMGNYPLYLRERGRNTAYTADIRIGRRHEVLLPRNDIRRDSRNRYFVSAIWAAVLNRAATG